MLKVYIVILIIISAIFIISGNMADIISNVTNQNQLGSLESQAEYTTVSNGHYNLISKTPIILHRIIAGSNDVFYVSDSNVTPSDNKGFLINATVPSIFEIGAIFMQGLIANVTSSDGVMFIYSNYK